MLDAPRLATAVIVEDDPNVRHLLVQVFESAGLAVTAVTNGTEGIDAVIRSRPLITSIDLGMPGIDGIEATRRIRAAGVDTHIVVITASRAEADVVLTLNAGADEYVYKPLRVRELRARIEAVLRRSANGSDAAAPPPAAERGFEKQWSAADVWAQPASVSSPVELLREPDEPSEPVIAWRDLVLNPTLHEVRIAGRAVALDPAETVLLATLLESKQITRTKADLALALRGTAGSTHRAGPLEKTAVESHIATLRRKLGDHGPKARYIEPVAPVGYRMISGF